MKARNGKRLFIILFNHICVIAFLICTLAIYLECAVEGRTVAYMLDESNKSNKFEETQIFQTMFEDAVADAIKFVVIRDQFETDGEFDGTKLIDIKQYANHKTLTMTESESVAYYLKDLIRWGQIGYRGGTYINDTEYEELKNQILVSRPTNSMDNVANTVEIDFYHENEKVTAYVNNSYSEIRDGEPYFMVLREEFCLPADGQQLILHTDSLEQFTEYTAYLQTSIDMLTTNFKLYREFESYFENSNFRYYISYESDGNRYEMTNVLDEHVKTGHIAVNTLTENFKEYGSYIYCDYENLSETESNVSIDESFIWSELGKYYYAGIDNVRLWFAVDTDYQSADNFSETMNSYSYQYGRFRTIFIAASVLLFMILLSYIVMAVLEEEKEKKSSLDRLPTEVSIAIGIILTGIPVIITCLALYVYFFESIVDISKVTTMYFIFGAIILGIGTLIANVLWLNLYLSMIRRMKAHMTWEASILKKCFNGAEFLVNHPKALIRTFIPYVLFVVLNVTMVALIVLYDAVWILVLLLLLDSYVGYRMYMDKRMDVELLQGIVQIKNGDFDYKIQTEEMSGEDKTMAEAINQIGGSIKSAVEASIKDEHLKTELITNVSHDIKTPLTSIISYIDLIKREQIDNPRVVEYIEILENKSQRLKQLTDDLVEASKISSGNIELNMQVINLNQLILQTLGEFEDRFMNKNLEVVVNLPEEPAFIMADSAGTWRVIENLYGNIVKYALDHTRVYLDVTVDEKVTFVLKNISSQKLNINAKELTERFIRGDASRTGEGSGLGLSIAESLVEAQGGEFQVVLDGDLFKVVIAFEATQPIDKSKERAIMDAENEISVEEKE